MGLEQMFPQIYVGVLETSREALLMRENLYLHWLKLSKIYNSARVSTTQSESEYMEGCFGIMVGAHLQHARLDLIVWHLKSSKTILTFPSKQTRFYA